MCRIEAQQNRDTCFVLVGRFNAEDAIVHAGNGETTETLPTMRDIAEGVRSSLVRFFPSSQLHAVQATGSTALNTDARGLDALPPGAQEQS